jgi:prevent-host-death family protein
MEVNIHEAKTHLSKLLERVAIGEEVVIAKAGKPVAKLVPIPSERPHFRLGSAKGEFTVPDDFNDPLPKEIEDLFW